MTSLLARQVGRAETGTNEVVREKRAGGIIGQHAHHRDERLRRPSFSNWFGLCCKWLQSLRGQQDILRKVSIDFFSTFWWGLKLFNTAVETFIKLHSPRRPKTHLDGPFSEGIAEEQLLRRILNEVVPRRARIQGSPTFVSLNFRLENKKEEEGVGERMGKARTEKGHRPGGCCARREGG